MGAFGNGEESSSDLDNGQQMFNESNSADVLERLDAGLRSLDHCLWDIPCLFASMILIRSPDKSKLPSWRYYSRSFLIPLLRWETQYLAVLQRRIRSPALDSYFSITANLGTHNFFMVVLPILFWCGHTAIGRGWVLWGESGEPRLIYGRIVHILASGVFVTGFLKDMLCLPRPLSPPLSRITMSASAALEYGFPSTHSTNAISVAVYALHGLKSADSTLSPNLTIFLEVLAYSYATSIMLGRIYCGMHGFLDVIIGAILGALITAIQCSYGTALDDFIYKGSLQAPLIVMLTILILVRIHPEPADDCPCFDGMLKRHLGSCINRIGLIKWFRQRCIFRCHDRCRDRKLALCQKWVRMGPSCSLNRAISARDLGLAQDNTASGGWRLNGM